MVVKFPSGPRPDRPGAEPGGDEHLAPVTPLRRAVASPERRRRPDASEPWNNTWANEPTSGAAKTRRAAERAGEPAVLGPAGITGDAAAGHTAADDTRAGDTWVGDTAAVDDEQTERMSRKAAGVTIRQLARRGMSRWELEQVLTKREIPSDVYAPELDRLEAMGVIDDASLATTLAFTQHSRKGLGRSAIELDLKRRHIAPELIEEALADIGADDELERATELAVKRIGQLSSYDDETARRRLHGFLARKGYDSSVVRQAMEAAFATRGRRGGVRFQ